MSKMPPKTLQYPQKKIQRLYFPQRGDPGFYMHSGKKHYQQTNQSLQPYASLGAPAPIRYSHHNYQSNSNTPRYGNIPLKRQSKNNIFQNSKPPQFHRQSLDQQVYSFKIGKEKPAFQSQLGSLEDKKPVSSFQTLYREQFEQKSKVVPRSSKMRVYTENPTEIAQKLQPKPIEPINHFSIPSRTKIKTEANQPGSQKIHLKPMRFNPTFLSSINY